MSLTTRPVNEIFGAEISGIDLTQPVDDDTQAELNELFLKHAVLIFRDQPLTPLQFTQAAKIFGNLMD